MLKANTRFVRPFAHLYNIAIFQYVTQNTTFTRQNTLNFIILEITCIPMYTLVLEVYVYIKVI